MLRDADLPCLSFGPGAYEVDREGLHILIYDGPLTPFLLSPNVNVAALGILFCSKYA
jgi:hypothetical protein